MKNHAKRTVILLVLIPVILILIAYGAFVFYYADRFSTGTWIDGTYVTGYTPVEVAETLSANTFPEKLLIYDVDGNCEQISYQDIEGTFEYLTELNRIQKTQNHFLWVKNFFAPQVYKITPQIQINKKLAVEKIHELSCYQKSKQASAPEVKIVHGAEGYELVDTTVFAVDPEKLVNVLQKSLAQGEESLDLATADCFKNYTLSDKMQSTKELFEKIDMVQSTQIIYTMNEKTLSLTKAEIADWIVVDDKGEFVLDELGDVTISANKVDAFTMKLSETFDSIGKDRQWASSSGRTVSVNNATFGFKVDTEAEKEQLIVSVCNGIHQEREPFSRNMDVDIGTGEIGDTYIEVDMSAQMLYYYVDGVLTVKTPVVTGNTSRGRGTPERVCYVYMKQKNRTLRGADYAAFVNYWMPVLGNIGMHDAGWRKEFGGDIYETNGSHGCINLPREAAAKIYDRVEIGTPVIMYY